MTEEFDLLRKRLERERLARKQAEQIAEENSRALFLKGQMLEETLLKEQTTRQELATLLTTLESFTGKLDLLSIAHGLHQYLNHFIESQVTSLYMLKDDRIQVIQIHADHPDQPQSNIVGLKTPFEEWQNFPGFEKASVMTREMINNLPDEMIQFQQATGCVMILPLISQEKKIGYLVAENHRIDAFHSDQIRPSLALANQASVALENARMFQEIEKLSRTDPLTGTRNRRGFEDEARRSLEIALRYKKPLSILMFDIDHFKKVNDTYGHPAGDQILIKIAESARKITRAGDLLTRLGGEEFCLLLPETSAQNAYQLAERLRANVASLEFENEGSKFGITISIGVAECLWAGDSLESILERSDQALYEAKESGRNRVVIRE